MDRNSFETASKPACPAAWRLAAAFAAALSLTTTAFAQTSWRTAAGAVKTSASSAPVVSSSASKDGTQALTYRFSLPQVSVAADGLADIALPGVENDGLPGQPLMPRMTVRIAIPQGRTAKGARVVPGESVTVAEGVTLRHAEREFRPGTPFVPTPRDAALYASADPFPATLTTEGRTSWKNGVAFYEFNLCPVVYVPATGVVSAYREISVTLTLAPARLRAGASADTDHAPFISAERARGVCELVDNPAVVGDYAATAPSRLKAAPGPAVSAVPPTVYAPPTLPCSSAESYIHVIITGQSLTNAFQSLVQYRRQGGFASTMVTVEDIMRTYGHGGDKQSTIREFIKDANAIWGVEYVVLGGDTTIIPARTLHCESGQGDVDEIPSDLYYQCLDGDFDGNGNGTYGEPDDGPNGGDVDLYAEVKIGRVSVETEEEFQNWFYKMRKYDEDCAANVPYTRAALFVGEDMGGQYYAKPALEQMRIGRSYTGFSNSRSAWGFMDVPDLFDADRLTTLYDADGEWTKEQLAAAMVAGDGVSVVNHLGHSDYDYNMKMGNEDADALRNETPFFVYSQGCIAGAFDKDCIAEHFTSSTRYGAFAGVWNARYGWYSRYDLSTGPSQRFHRCFWDAVFQQEHHEMGYANMISHERNSGDSHKNGTMRWVYFESNLFGDPIQSLCGPNCRVILDREAYRSDATMEITYLSATETNHFTAVLTITTGDGIGRPTIEIELPFVGLAAGGYEYSALVDLSTLAVAHDDVINVSILEETAQSATAVIDDVAPGFADVRLSNGDEGVASVSWKTYKPDKGNAAGGDYVYEDTAGACFVDVTAPFVNPTAVESPAYATSHAVTVEDLEQGLYYVRILAVDKAGNSNVWNSASVTSLVNAPDPAEYGHLMVTPRELRADYDMERDASGWTVSADNDGCWQLGVPTYGPVNATRCWGTVLDGRYPDGASASLVSPEITLRESPTIVFRHWYDIQASPLLHSNDGFADYGAIEIMATGSDGTHADMSVVDGAWHNAAPFAMEEIPNGFVQGTSEGWETVRLVLPEEYAGKTIRLRFRFVSDTYPANRYPADYPAANVGNPAGWYIDAVKFYDVPSVPGVVLTVLDQDEAPITVVRPGATTTLKLSSFNVSYDTLFPAGGTSVALSAPGVAPGKVTLAEESPVPVTYGSIPACTAKIAAETLELSVDSSVPAGTPITLTQTIVLGSGATLESTARLRVGAIGEVSGTVVQPEYAGLPNPNPVVGATVVINSSEGDFACTTGADGAFLLEGIASNRIVRVTASYGFATASSAVVAPATGVVIELPLAEFGLSTNEFTASVHLSASATAVDPIAVDAFVLSNVFVLAAEDGNNGPSCNLEYEITGFVDNVGNTPPWFHLGNPTGSIAPGESLTLDMVLDPSQADPSAAQSVTLTIASNGWNIRSTNVVVTLDVTADIKLEERDATATDDFDPEPVDENGAPPVYSNDFDGYLEPGELGQVWFTVYNPSVYETIDLFEAVVTVLSGNATIITDPPYTDYSDGDTVSWSEIPPQASAKCERPITVLMDENVVDGDVIEFLVSGLAMHGDVINEQTLHFFITNTVRTAVVGEVLAENIHPALPEGELNGVPDVRVSATDANGNVFYSNYTASNGVYAVAGLTPGEKYWISTTIPDGSKFVPPFAKCITADSDTYSLDIVGTTYGEQEAHLRVYQMFVWDGDGFVDKGETFSIWPSFFNDGSFAIKNGLSARLTLPDEFECDNCMEILSDTIDYQDTVLANTYASFDNGFEVKVNDDAMPGDYQRFLIEVWENVDANAENAAEPKRWYFDIVVEVKPRLYIAGTVLTSSGEALPGVTVAARGLDGSYSATTTADVSTGEYIFDELASGAYEVSVVSAPRGYIVTPAAITNEVVDESVEGVDFTLEPWTITPSADFLVPGADGGTGSFALEIPEGVSTNVSFQIANSGAEAEDITVSIVYHRQASELLPPESIAASVAEARAAVARAAGGDWTMSDAGSFSHTEFEFVFKDGTTTAQRDAYLASRGFKATYHFKTIPASIATPAGGAATALASAALSSPAAAFATGGDDILVSAQPAVLGAVADSVTPDDPRYAEQWALANDRQTGGTRLADIGAEDAWEFAQTTGSRDVLVAVTDTGILYTHPDLAANWSGLGWNYVDDSSACSDGEGHGTHVAGIIGAVGNNGLGVCGVNWKVSLMAQRISTPESGFASSADIARSFEDAIDAGVSINNNSWGGPFYSDVLYRVMKKAQDYDMLFVCAAGNDAKDVTVSPNYPASMSQWLDNVIVVAASDHDGRIAEFSNYSPAAVHLAAPGVDILSTAISESNGALADGALVPDGNYVLMSGTSMATPYVSGAAAFLKAVVPTASYGFIRDALLQSVRKDPLLAEYVSTSGHLDLSAAVRILGSQWLRFDDPETVVVTTNVTIDAGGSVDLTLLVNDPAMLRAGEYTTDVRIEGELTSVTIPFELTVTPDAIADIDAVEIVDEEAEDGLASRGEEVTLSITVRNVGTLDFEDLTATLLANNGGEVLDANWNYGFVSGLDTSMPGQFLVRFPASGDTADFTLVLTSGGETVAELPVTIALFDGSVLNVMVVDASGAAVANAAVEILGAGAGRGVTGPDGIARIVAPAASGSFTLRVFADGFVRYEGAVDPSAGQVVVRLGHATLEPAETVLDIHVPEGMSLTTNLVLSAVSGGTLDVAVKPAARARVAVFDDRDDSAFLVSRLEGMGFDVDYFPSNYIYTAYNYGPSEMAEIVQAARYTWDDALLFPYDAVIAVLSGANGSGRLLAPLEQQAFADYVARGGHAILSGTTPLARPDNVELADFIGLSADACEVAPVATIAALAAEDGLGAPFVTLAAGDAFAVDAGDYDASFETNFVSGASAAMMDGDTAVSKIYLSERSDLDGQAVLWNGNATDWQHDGAALDVLRGYLYSELVTSSSPSWLAVSDETLAIADATDRELALTLNPERTLGAGTYEATVLLMADVDGARCVPVTVILTVDPPTLRAHNLSGAVTGAGGRPLVGDGGTDSCIVQLIYAGPDGIPDPPAADGSATGDDMILAATGTGLGFARFGEGVAVDSGTFNAFFNLSFEGFEVGAEGFGFYARAWDAPSAAAAIAYGDSGVSNVIYEAGLPLPIDFGSWSLTNAVAGPLSDANGDGIPDAWTLAYRPDLDPRALIEPLGTEIVCETNDYIQTAAAPANYSNADGNPARVFVTDKFVFVLEQYTHRIAVYDRAARTNLFYYGATYDAKNNTNGGNTPGTNYTDTAKWAFGTGEGGFKQPFGMALDTFSGQNRFAVADTGNNRVQIFSFDPDSGEITFLSAYGTKSSTPGTGAANGTFTEPYAVAFMPGNDLLIADTGNYRVARVNYNGGAWTWRKTFQFSDKSLLSGVCYGKDSLAGFWVADAGKTLQRVSFHHIANFSETPVVSLGTAESGDFTTPRDVQLWTVGDHVRIVASDHQGSRLRILDPLADASGKYTDLVAVADIGSASDASLQRHQQLWLPVGVFPVADTNLLYVADYGHNMVKWYGLTIDADGDGMDDLWEDMNGLDSTRDDALDDADGDGLPNIGEYRADTDPQNADSDGDGAGDLYEMHQIDDPLDPDSTPPPGAKFGAIAANPERIFVGDSVTITVNLDRAVEGAAQVKLYAADGTCFVSDALAVNGATATYAYTADGTVVGPVDAVFTFADCDPPVTNVVALFEILARLGSVKTFDAATGVATNVFTYGSTVRIVATFDAPVPGGEIALVGTNGVTLASGAMTVFGDTLSFEWMTSADYTGPVNVTLTVPYCDPAEKTYATLFIVAAPDDPNPPQPPAEEYEEVRWHIDSIAIADTVATLTWTLPQQNVPASGECLFRIEYRTSLTTGDWTTLVENLAATAQDVNLSALGTPPSLFLRLFWTNKVK